MEKEEKTTYGGPRRKVLENKVLADYRHARKMGNSVYASYSIVASRHGLFWWNVQYIVKKYKA